MPRPISLNIVIKTLKNKGFFFVSQRGSHAKFRKHTNPVRTVIVKTGKKEIPYGPFRSILSMSGLSEKDFRKMR